MRLRKLVLLLVLAALGLTPAAAHELDPDPPEDEDAPTAHRTRVHLGRGGFTPRVGGAALALLAPRTPEDALALVPGLVLVQHGNEGKGHQIYLRGFDAVHGSDFAVHLDGVRLNEASNVHATGYLDLALIPTSLVREVLVDKGPFALDQGLFSAAGSADYRLGVAPDQRGVVIGYELGTTLRNRLALRWSPQDPGDESLAGGELVLDDGFGEARSLTRLALAARLAPPAARGPDTIAATFLVAVSRFELPSLVAEDDLASGFVPSFHAAYDTLGRGESDRFLGLLRHQHERAHLRVATTMHAGARALFLRENFTGLLADPTAGDARTQREHRAHAGLATELDALIGPHLTLDADAGLRLDALDQVEDHVDRRGAPLTRTRALRADLLEAHLASALTLRLEPIMPLVFRAGLHFVVVQHHLGDTAETFVAPLPKLGLRARLLSALSLRAAYARAARPPEARASLRRAPTSERAPGGLPALTLVDALELGLRLRVHGLEATLVGFSTWVARESVFDHASGQSLELDGSVRLGLELGLHLMPLDVLSLRVDLTVSDARYRRSDRPVPGVARVVASAEVLLRMAPLRVILRALAVGPRPLAHGATGAGLVDLGLGADLTLGRWRLGLTIDNLLDLDQRQGVYHFASRWDPTTEPSLIPRLHYAAGAPLTARLIAEIRL